MPERSQPVPQRRDYWLDGTDILVVAFVAVIAGALMLAGSGTRSQPSASSPCESTGARTKPVGDAGFAGGSVLPGRTDAELIRDLEGMAATGASYLRFDFDWSYLEPERGQFRWEAVDRVVAGADACDLEVIALVTYSPEWARETGTSEHSPPRDVNDFARFVTEAVSRYLPRGVDTWEIWNEPNIDLFWEPAPDAPAYTELLIAAYDAVKGVDPDATVISGGLATLRDAPDGSTISAATFLEGMYEAGAAGHLDALGHHPYSFPTLPSQDADTAFGQTRRLYELMEQNGDGDKLIWGTEFGAPTGSAGFAATFVAEYATAGYEAWRTWPFTGPLLWYTYRDPGRDPSDPEDNFGLVTADYGAKEPALSAFEAAIHR